MGFVHPSRGLSADGMPEVNTVCFEGLPGAGKSTLISELLTMVPDAAHIPETAVELPADPERGDFVRNDLRKEELLRLAEGVVLMDRYWPSTVTYFQADQRLSGRQLTSREGCVELYGRDLLEPSFYVLLDSLACVRTTAAADSRWPERAFREAVREAYLAFAESHERVLVISADEFADSPGALARRLRALICS